MFHLDIHYSAKFAPRTSFNLGGNDLGKEAAVIALGNQLNNTQFAVITAELNPSTWDWINAAAHGPIFELGPPIPIFSLNHEVILPIPIFVFDGIFWDEASTAWIAVI